MKQIVNLLVVWHENGFVRYLMKGQSGPLLISYILMITTFYLFKWYFCQ
jgi:hypothetical protein